MVVELTTALRFGTPVILFVLVVAVVRLNQLVCDMKEIMVKMQSDVVLGVTCKATRVGLDTRLCRVETLLNGKLK